MGTSEEVVELTVAGTVRGDAGNWTCSAQVSSDEGTEVGPPVTHTISLVVVGEFTLLLLFPWGLPVLSLGI